MQGLPQNNVLTIIPIDPLKKNSKSYPDPTPLTSEELNLIMDNGCSVRVDFACAVSRNSTAHNET